VDVSSDDAPGAMVVQMVNGPQPEVEELDEMDQRLLDQIKEAIDENMIDSNFNVTMLQEKMGMGNKQLYRKVKMLTGQTPVELIRDMRLRKAAKLLKAGKFSVSEVMYTVGFSNSSYFSKCFSKLFGMSPSEYMKR
jgi:AraC-like DNA-binding protein